METTFDHISVIGKDYKYKYVNASYTKAHGLLKNKIIGTSVPDLLGNDLFNDLIKPKLDRCFSGEEVFFAEWFDFQIYKKRYMAVSYLPLISPDGKIDSLTVISRDITERKQAEKQIKKDLKIKTALIQEIYHRTKNNMAVVTAMLSMESRRSDNEFVNTTFKEVINKIRSMSLVHHKLYEAKDLSNISLKDYVEDLSKLIMQSYGILAERINVILDLHDVKISIDSAVPLGLIINELISNIIKHAFPNNKKGEIIIRLFIEEDKAINLELIDNGVGFSSDFDPRKDGSMGIISVFSIAEDQLKGEISVKSENGLRWHIKIKDDKHEERV